MGTRLRLNLPLGAKESQSQTHEMRVSETVCNATIIWSSQTKGVSKTAILNNCAIPSDSNSLLVHFAQNCWRQLEHDRAPTGAHKSKCLVQKWHLDFAAIMRIPAATKSGSAKVLRCLQTVCCSELGGETKCCPR